MDPSLRISGIIDVFHVYSLIPLCGRQTVSFSLLYIGEPGEPNFVSLCIDSLGLWYYCLSPKPRYKITRDHGQLHLSLDKKWLKFLHALEFCHTGFSTSLSRAFRLHNNVTTYKYFRLASTFWLITFFLFFVSLAINFVLPKKLYSGVLLKWEFFIKMRAACCARSLLPSKKRSTGVRMAASTKLSF